MTRIVFLIAVFLLSSMAMFSPATAQGIHCGGTDGEGCWSPARRNAHYRKQGLPEWGRPARQYYRSNPAYRHHRTPMVRPVRGADGYIGHPVSIARPATIGYAIPIAKPTTTRSSRVVTGRYSRTVITVYRIRVYAYPGGR